MAETEAEKPKRPPGRPKGYPKSGGRQKGTPNRDRTATIERIQKEADPILFLCKVSRGDRLSAAPEPGAKKKTWCIPTIDQRISAAQTLCRKVLPDMKAIEHTGDGIPQITEIIRRIVDPSVKPDSPKSNGAGEPDEHRQERPPKHLSDRRN